MTVNNSKCSGCGGYVAPTGNHFTCTVCGGISGEMTRADIIKLVNINRMLSNCDINDLCYFDFMEVTAFGEPHRVHGWFDVKSRWAVQFG